MSRVVRRPPARYRGRLAVVAAAMAVGVASCGDTPGEPDRRIPASVEITSVPVPLRAGESLQLTASVKDAQGVPIPDAALVWSSSDPEAVAVSATGLAQGRKAREATVTASASGVEGRTTIRVVPGAPASLTKATGDAQTGPAAEELAGPVTVRVADAHDNPVPGAAVLWTAGGANGSVSTERTVTDDSGIASIRWTLGPTKGTQHLGAVGEALPGSPVQFSATATPNGRIIGHVTLTGALVTRVAPALGGLASAGSAGTAALTRAGAPLLPMRSTRAMHGAGARTASGEQLPVGLRGSLIVRFRPQSVGAPDARPGRMRVASVARAVEQQIQSRLHSARRAAAFDVAGTSPALFAARIRVDPDRADAVRARLLADPAVLSVRNEAIAYALEERTARTPAAAPPARTPNDPLFNPQAWHYSMVDLPEAWRSTTGSRDAVVAVVDDGIRFDHPAIAANLTSDGYDFVSSLTAGVCGVQRDIAGDGDGYDPDPTNPAEYDCETGGQSTIGNHGLHVAGTIGAVGDDGVGTAGASWAVRIRPVRVLGVAGFGTHYDIAQGVLYAAGLPADNGAGGTVQAATGARIINMSLGGPSDSPELRDAVRAATAAGALIVAAAGNQSTSAPHYPAAYPEVLAVSALGPDLRLASYSNFGAEVDIAAPGGDFDDCGATCGVASTTWNFATSQPSYAYYSGTSMAAPHVSGVAALLLGASPSLSAAQLRARLTDFAVDLGPAGRDDQYGAGVVNALNSLTASRGPARALHAVLYDAETGARVATARVAADGTFAFTALDNGRYLVFAGEDEDADGLTGLAGRRWGAHGDGASRPREVVVQGAGAYAAGVAAGWPDESEPNDAPGSAERLVVYGYVQGQIATSSDGDVFAIVVPAGRYTITTSAWDGACGYALEANTAIDLTDAQGAVIQTNDDIDSQSRCSRITATLAAGTYHVNVRAPGGRYRVALSAEP